MNKGIVIILALVLFISAMVVAGCSGSSSRAGANIAPDFNLNDLNGESVSLNIFQGKVVLINFWATTCPPCVEEMPYFQELYQEWSDRGDRVILAVNIGESAAIVSRFVQGNAYTFPVLLDSRGKVSQLYQIQYTPTSILVGENSEVKFRIIGAFKDKNALVNTIENALSE